MPANAKIKTACPVCGAKYKVAAASIGHSARCSQCKTKFRVNEYTRLAKRPPTEEDILTWLNEETEEPEYLISPSPSRMDAPRTRTAEPDQAIQPAARTDTEAPPAGPPPHRLKRSITKAADPLQFRKTG